jgi:hypothetical protein
MVQSSPGVKLISSKQVRLTIHHIWPSCTRTYRPKYPNGSPSHCVSPTRRVVKGQWKQKKKCNSLET